MLQRLKNRIKDKLTNKHYAVFVDEKGRQREVISINNDDKKFTYNNKTYVKNTSKYSNFYIKTKKLFFLTQHHNYFFYQYDYSEPINFTKEKLNVSKNNNPYIAEDINSILQTKVLKDLNKVSNNFLKNLEPKQILIGLGIIGVIIYIISSGGV